MIPVCLKKQAQICAEGCEGVNLSLTLNEINLTILTTIGLTLGWHCADIGLT